MDITNSSGQKLLWCVENVYDDGFNDENSFYSWGETSVKANQGKTGNNATYSWYRTSTSGEQNRAYKYGYSKNNDSYMYNGGTLTKYNSSDGKKVLDTTDDVAYVKSNGKWRIPSVADFQALIDAATAIDSKTGQEITEGRDLVGGPAEGSDNTKYKIRNKNTNHYILFPMRGYKLKGSANAIEYLTTNGGYYWTREIGQYLYNAKVYQLSATGTTAGTISDNQHNRPKGCLIRGVMYK